jgi:hypothetical protein
MCSELIEYMILWLAKNRDSSVTYSGLKSREEVGIDPDFFFFVF